MEPQLTEPAKTRGRSNWNLLSNHGHVLVCISADQDIRLRDIASSVGLTERAVFAIVEDLEAAGMLQRIKVGRRNRYEVHTDVPMQHPVERGRPVGSLMGVFTA